ncbi:MAG TPA: hypothetical protein VKA95_14775, partial [Nitrososphaeraceae archaeon]|nr:hypothetical protein [Nitrososphaeraceae archaeon]
PQAIPNKSNQNLKLEFVDSWKDPDKKFDNVGDRLQYELSLSGGPFLRLCMAYSDLPGRGLQNNLNLSLMHKESGQLWLGNQDRLSHVKIRDPDNNVEVIRLENPLAGTYNVFIDCMNMLLGPQDFALVLTGENISSLVKV